MAKIFINRRRVCPFVGPCAVDLKSVMYFSEQLIDFANKLSDLTVTNVRPHFLQILADTSLQSSIKIHSLRLLWVVRDKLS